MEASLIPTPKVDAPAPPQLPHDAPHTAARDFLVVSPEGLQRPPLLLLLLLLRLLLQSIHSHSSLLSFWAGPESLGNSMVSLHFVR